MTLSDCAIVIYFAHLSIKKSSNNVSPSDKLYWKEQDFSERPSFLCVCRFFCAPCTRPVRKVSSRCWWSLRSQPYFVNLLSPHTLSTPEVRSFRKCIKRKCSCLLPYPWSCLPYPWSCISWDSRNACLGVRRRRIRDFLCHFPQFERMPDWCNDVALKIDTFPNSPSIEE